MGANGNPGGAAEEGVIEFFVPGIAKPAGSKKAFGFQLPNGRIRTSVVDACKKSKDWKSVVAHTAHAYRPVTPLTGPLKVTLRFQVARLKGHYGTGKNASKLKESAPVYVTVKPDVLKLARAVEDALTGVVYADDALIVEEVLSKVYHDQPGVWVHVEPLPSRQS